MLLIVDMDLLEKLREHLSFLESSARDFDSAPQEALRMAVSLRVLFHDTGSSTSLLTHLGIKDSAKILSTFEPIPQKPGELIAFIPLGLNWDGKRQALLDDAPWKQFIPVAEWWAQLVMTGNNNLSRKEVILAAANQDGGAHVDANPGEKTRELKEGVGKHTLRIGGMDRTTVLNNHHFYLIRQFTHEVLNSPDIKRKV